MNVREHTAFTQAFKAGLPDAHMEIVNVVEAGDRVVIEGRFKGTHTSELVTPQGAIPASGNAIDLPFADYFQLANGKIIDHHVY